MTIYNFLKNRKSLLLLFVLFLLSLLPFLWLGKNPIWQSGDFSFPLQPEKSLQQHIYSWWDFDFGKFRSRSVAESVFFHFPIYGLSTFGFPLVLIQKLLFSFWIFISGISFFVLINFLLENSDSKKIVAFVGTLFYMYNMYSLNFHWDRALIFFAYSFLPLTLYFSFKFFEESTTLNWVALFFLFFLWSPAGSNPLYVLVPFFLIMLVLWLRLFLENSLLKHSISKAFKKTFFIFLAAFLAWSFFFLPFFSLVGSESIRIADQFASDFDKVTEVGSFTSFANGFRFLGHKNFWSGFKGFDYLPYKNVYQSPLFIMLGFSLPLVAFGTLLFGLSKKTKKYVLIFSVLFLVFYLFLSGPNFPFGFIFSFFYIHVPGFHSFRILPDKVGLPIVISVSILFSIGLEAIMNMLSVKKTNRFMRFRKGLIYFFLCTVVLISFPFYTGQIFPDFDLSIHHSGITEIPQYYEDVASILNAKKPYSRVFILPRVTNFRRPYVWDFRGGDPLNSYLDYGSITMALTGNEDSLQTELFRLDEHSLVEALENYAKIWNVGDIVLEKDIDPLFYSRTDKVEFLEEAFDNSDHFDRIGEEGELILYKLNQTHFLPHMFAPRLVITSPGDFTSLFQFLATYDSERRLAVYTNFTENVNRVNSIFGEGDLLISGNIVDSLLSLDRYEYLWGSDWAWPEVSVPPLSLKYKFVAVKERWLERQAKNPTEKADVLIWHASKRIAENSKWGGTDNTDADAENTESLLAGYLSKAGKAVEVLKSVPEEEREEDYWGMVRKVVAYADKAEEALAENADKELVMRMEQFNGRFRQWVEEEGQFWCPEGMYCFEVDIPIGGEYKIYVDNQLSGVNGRENIGRAEISSLERAEIGEISPEDGTEIEGKIEQINDEKVEIGPEEMQENSNWVSYGEYGFAEGEGQRVVLELPEPENLIEGEQGLDRDIGILESGQYFTESSDSDSGTEDSVELEPSENAGDMVVESGEQLGNINFLKGTLKSYEVSNWEEGEKYNLSFDYKARSGKIGVAVLEGTFDWEKLEELEADYEEVKDNPDFFKYENIFQKSLKTKISSYEEYKETGGWEEFETELKADISTRGANIFIYTIPSEDGIADVQVRNASLRKVLEPKLVLRKDTENADTDTENADADAENADEERRIPEIKFVRVNPTKYKVQVSGATEAYPLVFSESFHPDWKVWVADKADIGAETADRVGWRVLGKSLAWVVDLFLDDKGYGEEVASYFDGEIMEGTHRDTFLEPATFETWGKKPLDAEHLKVNGYANSWYIEPEDVGGAEDYELIIEFWPQRLFYLGLLISGLTLVGCVGYLLLVTLRMRRGNG